MDGHRSTCWSNLYAPEWRVSKNACLPVIFNLVLKSLYRFFFIFRLKVLSFMNSDIKKPKKISASKYVFLSKKVRNLSFDRATGDWCLWRSSSKTSFAVISVLQGETWQTKYLKLRFSVFRCVLNRKRRNGCVDSVNIQPEAAIVPSSASSHQDFIMEWMHGQKGQLSQNCLIGTLPNSKNVTGTAKNCLIFEI